VIGDTVNIASRLQETLKTLQGCDIVFTEHTRAALMDPVAWRATDQGPVTVRGKHQPLTIYSLDGPAGAASMPEAGPLLVIGPDPQAIPAPVLEGVR
jgi:class 3 adenylate cyclase